MLRGKNRSQKSITFEGQSEMLTTIGDVAASHALTVIAAAFPLAQQSKVLRVAISAAAISGSPTVQLVLGTIAPGAIGSTDTLAVPGTSVFAGPVTLTAGPYIGTTIAPANMDVLYPDAGVLTVRVGTGASDTVTGPLNISISKIGIDAHPNAPLGHALTPQDF